MNCLTSVFVFTCVWNGKEDKVNNPKAYSRLFFFHLSPPMIHLGRLSMVILDGNLNWELMLGYK